MKGQLPGVNKATVIRAYKERKAEVEKKIVSCRTRLLSLLIPDNLGAWSAIRLDHPVPLFLVVATVEGKLVCAQDGTNVFEIGRLTASKHGACSWPPLSSCYLGFPSPSQARSTAVEVNGRVLDAPKVLMEFMSSGMAYLHASSGVLAVSRLRPVRLFPHMVPPPQQQQPGPPQQPQRLQGSPGAAGKPQLPALPADEHAAAAGRAWVP